MGTEFKEPTPPIVQVYEVYEYTYDTRVEWPYHGDKKNIGYKIIIAGDMWKQFLFTLEFEPCVSLQSKRCTDVSLADEWRQQEILKAIFGKHFLPLILT